MYKILATLSTLLFLFSISAYAASKTDQENTDILVFDDTQLEDELVYPDWFKLSLGDLSDDLEKAVKDGKNGIITYFGQKRCAYCKQFFETSLAEYRYSKLPARTLRCYRF